MFSSLKHKYATACTYYRSDGINGIVKLTEDKLGVFYRRLRRSVRIDGCSFLLTGMPDYVRYLMISRKYESGERQALKDALFRDMPVVELGGAAGIVSCVTNKALADPSRHVVVEANAVVIELLMANRKRNACRFSVYNKAIAYGGSEVEFTIDDNFLVGRLGLTGARRVSVPATTLSTLLREAQFDACNLICDIEGAECAIVDNELDLLSKQVACFIVETHPAISGADVAARMMERLFQAGFVPVGQYGPTYALHNKRYMQSA
jgi:FkbM family methyltransferase